MIPLTFKFKPGDKVTFTNDQGCVFPGKTIVAYGTDDFAKEYGPRYFITPTDTPWFSFHEKELSLE